MCYAIQFRCFQDRAQHLHSLGLQTRLYGVYSTEQYRAFEGSYIYKGFNIQQGAVAAAARAVAVAGAATFAGTITFTVLASLAIFVFCAGAVGDILDGTGDLDLEGLGDEDWGSRFHILEEDTMYIEHSLLKEIPEMPDTGLQDPT
ncbi:hypothetical protein PM082_011828 [Marasmius tenuissimus]|nr:hypothetical protein PM082_011828 [Marasmius tenuissimus]